MDRQIEAQLAALEAGEFRFLRGKLLWSRIFPAFFRLDPDDVVLNVGVGQGPQVLAYGGRFRLMVGVDTNVASLQRSRLAAQLCGIPNYAAVCADAEALPFRSGAFDKILAIDVIQFVDDPSQMCGEAARVLRPRGDLLMTFPALYARLRLLAARVGRVVRALAGTRRGSARSGPKRLPRIAPLRTWYELIGRAGFRFVRSEATSVVPPLHWLGLPRFWFRNDLIHSMDRRLSRMPGIRVLGQAVMAVFTLPAHAGRGDTP